MEPSCLLMRACASGRLSFAYFSVAADRKVSRHQGETTDKKESQTQSHQIPPQNTTRMSSHDEHESPSAPHIQLT